MNRRPDKHSSENSGSPSRSLGRFGSQATLTKSFEEHDLVKSYSQIHSANKSTLMRTTRLINLLDERITSSEVPIPSSSRANLSSHTVSRSSYSNKRSGKSQLECPTDIIVSEKKNCKGGAIFLPHRQTPASASSSSRAPRYRSNSTSFSKNPSLLKKFKELLDLPDQTDPHVPKNTDHSPPLPSPGSEPHSRSLKTASHKKQSEQSVGKKSPKIPKHNVSRPHESPAEQVALHNRSFSKDPSLLEKFKEVLDSLDQTDSTSMSAEHSPPLQSRGNSEIIQPLSTGYSTSEPHSCSLETKSQERNGTEDSAEKIPSKKQRDEFSRPHDASSVSEEHLMHHDDVSHHLHWEILSPVPPRGSMRRQVSDFSTLICPQRDQVQHPVQRTEPLLTARDLNYIEQTVNNFYKVGSELPTHLSGNLAAQKPSHFGGHSCDSEQNLNTFYRQESLVPSYPVQAEQSPHNQCSIWKQSKALLRSASFDSVRSSSSSLEDRKSWSSATPTHHQQQFPPDGEHQSLNLLHSQRSAVLIHSSRTQADAQAEQSTDSTQLTSRRRGRYGKPHNFRAPLSRKETIQATAFNEFLGKLKGLVF